MFRGLWERVESVGFESRGSVPQVRCFGDIEPEEVKWIWGSRIPLGMLSEIVGDPDVGKSTLCCAIAASVSRGQALPGDLQLPRNPRSVLFLSAEDSPGATIRPRLERAGADLSRCHILDGIADEHGDLHPINLRAREHRQHLAEVLDRIEASLLVIDPIVSYLGTLDSHKDAEVRGVLSPLSSIAQNNECGIILIRHLSKLSSARKALHRAGGSIGFSAAVRSSLLVGPIEEGSPERAIVSLKHNLSDCPPSVGFTLEDGEFRWTSELREITASDLLESEANAQEKSEREEAAEWLAEVLKEGPLPASEVQERAEGELSCSFKTLKRAKRRAGVESKYDGRTRGWSWQLKDGAGPRGPTPKGPLLQEDPGPLSEPIETEGDSPAMEEPEAQPIPMGPLTPEPQPEAPPEAP
jgi:RecA-family ATPase